MSRQRQQVRRALAERDARRHAEELARRFRIVLAAQAAGMPLLPADALTRATRRTDR